MLAERGVSTSEVNVVMECSSDETIKRLTESDNGVTILPYEVVSREVEAGKLKAIRVSDADLVYPVWVAYRSSQKDTPPVKDILTHIRAKVKVK